MVFGVVADAAKEVVQDSHLCVLVFFDVRNAFNSAPLASHRFRSVGLQPTAIPPS